MQLLSTRNNKLNYSIGNRSSQIKGWPKHTFIDWVNNNVWKIENEIMSEREAME